MNTQSKILGLTLFNCLLLTACNSTQSAIQSTSAAVLPTTMFSENAAIIPFEQRSRRKWDSAVIADLDQDGYQDLLITEHSQKVLVHWNNKGVFSPPQDVVGGDTHGITAGDFDHDGRMDLVISQGGGGGNKPRYPKIFHVNSDRSIDGGEEFKLVDRTRGRAAKLVDSDNDGKLDLVLSAFPLKSQTDGANHLYHNQGEAGLVFSGLLPQAKWLGYRTLVTDYNSDNIADLIFYGGDNMVAVTGGKGLNYTNDNARVFKQLADISDISSMAEIDFDNDGDFDLVLTRAKHQFDEQRYYDSQTQRFAFFVRNQKFQFDDLVIKGNLKLENLQMAFPDFDVFVGKRKHKISFNVDKHGSKQLELSNEEAQGWPDDMSAHGLYIGYLGNDTWRIAGETSSPTSGVVHGVTSSPSVSNIENLPLVLLENQNGVFIDATAKLGIQITEQTTSATVGDFNNDGWSDIFIVRYGNMAKQTEQILLLNKAGKTFAAATEHGLISKELGATGGAAESFDYDQDGDLDLVYSNERGLWHLFTNNSTDSTQQFVRVTVGDSPTRAATAIGAKLTIQACGNVYIRVVGASSSAFSQGANNQLHVGLGECHTIDSAELRWTNGEHQLFNMQTLNTNFPVGSF
jgi:hypothetical protein